MAGKVRIEEAGEVSEAGSLVARRDKWMLVLDETTSQSARLLSVMPSLTMLVSLAMLSISGCPRAGRCVVVGFEGGVCVWTAACRSELGRSCDGGVGEARLY